MKAPMIKFEGKSFPVSSIDWNNVRTISYVVFSYVENQSIIAYHAKDSTPVIWNEDGTWGHCYMNVVKALRDGKTS